MEAPWARTARGAGLLAADGRMAPTIFSAMSQLAKRTGALDLGQGFPDQPGPSLVLETAERMIRDGRNQYPPARGDRDLIDAIIEHQHRFYGIDLGPADVMVTAGASEALAATMLAYLEPGDEVVVFEPYYDLYAGITALAGAELVGIPLQAPDFEPRPQDVERAFSRRTRMVLVNTPHNPTGALIGDDVQEQLVRLAVKHDAIIVTDEVYEHLVFGGEHVPLAARPEIRDRLVSISSGGKTFSTTGWKIGWLT